jgi:hypothetical protein
MTPTASMWVIRALWNKVYQNSSKKLNEDNSDIACTSVTSFAVINAHTLFIALQMFPLHR